MSFGYYPTYQNNTPYQQQLIQMQQQQQQNNSFIHVPSEEVARSYSVTPGGSVTFINDNAPYCYTKTAGFSQFDAPIFRKFRLVEETDETGQKPVQEISQTSIEALSTEVQNLRSRLDALEAKVSPSINQSQQSERRMKNEPSNKQRQ